MPEKSPDMTQSHTMPADGPVSTCEGQRGSAAAQDQLPHVVIVGAGFAGLSAAKALCTTPVKITVIDRQNYHLFQPLLYQVATAALSPADIAWPIRSMLRHQRNACVVLGKVSGIDASAKIVHLSEGEPIAYDYLVIGTGARHSYFGRNDWEQYAPGIKNIADATALRQKILLAFERAEVEKDPAERERLLTFVIIGGGPTGVEMAGAIAELARHSIAKDFNNISPDCTQIHLIEAGDRILAQFAPELSAVATRNLEQMGVKVQTKVRVEQVTESGIQAENLQIGSRTVIWAAGVKASPAADWLGVPADRTGRVVVNEFLNIPNDPDIYVVGDTAAYTPDGETRPLPGVAPVAKQMGAFAGQHIAARVRNKARLAAQKFCYRNLGSMATIGRNNAIADFGYVRLQGFVGWWVWGLAHIYFLISLKNRVVVSLNWLWQYLTWQRGARLITMDPAPRPVAAAATADPATDKLRMTS
jgi:NADH dehydrogenase FAD-containing subunit